MSQLFASVRRLAQTATDGSSWSDSTRRRVVAVTPAHQRTRWASAQLEQYENKYRLCYIRGPEGIIIELAEQIR